MAASFDDEASSEVEATAADRQAEDGGGTLDSRQRADPLERVGEVGHLAVNVAAVPRA